MSRKSDNLTYLRMIAVVASWAALMWFGGQKHATTEVPSRPSDSSVTIESSGTAGEAAETFKVISITDGDTADILKDGQPLRLRFAGIDTPEKGQPFGNNAKQALSDRIGGKFVRLRGYGLDKYNRAITDIYLPGETELFINRELVKRGLAWHYKEYSDDESLARDEVKARAAKLGLWSDRRHVAPWDWRKLSKVERDQLR